MTHARRATYRTSRRGRHTGQPLPDKEYDKQRLRECGELTPRQELETVEVREGGFAFTTQSQDEE